MPQGKEEGKGFRGLPFPYAQAHVHQQHALQWEASKDGQELLGHSDVSTTMNIYAHATREAKRTSARLLDKVVCGE